MIGIIKCDLDENQETNGAHIINSIIPNSEIINFCSGEEIANIKDYQGFIISGSRASYNDDEPWIRTLRKLLLEINEFNIPCLGVCFGMQLIADVFEGQLQNNYVDEEGFSFINIEEGQETIFKNLSTKLMVFQTHHDAVIDLPRGAILLAKNNNCIQAFQYFNFYGVQFHPEITANIATIMATRDNENVQKKLNGVPKDYELPRKIFENFVRLVTG